MSELNDIPPEDRHVAYMVGGEALYTGKQCERFCGTAVRADRKIRWNKANAELKRIALELLEKWRDAEGAAIGYECEGRTYQERADCVAALDSRIAEYKARIEAAEPEAVTSSTPAATS